MIDERTQISDREHQAVEPLRVCFVSLQYWPAVGGAEARVEKQAHQLRAMGHAVTVVTLRHQRSWPRKEERHGVQVVRLGGWRRGDGPPAHRPRSHLDRQSCDVERAVAPTAPL